MTLLMCAFLDCGVGVKANYELRDWDLKPHSLWSRIDFYDLVNLLRGRQAGLGRWLAIDELQGWLDAYVSQSKASRFGSLFLFQSGKMGWNIIFTSQRTMRADCNWREMADLRFMADKTSDSFVYTELDVTETDDDVPTGRVFTIPFDVAKLWWNRYDTYEPVVPIGMEEFYLEMEKFDSDRMNLTVNRQAELLIKSGIELKGLSVAVVKDYLLELGEPVAFSGPVCSRTKRLLLRKEIPRLEIKEKSSSELVAQVPSSLLSRLHREK